MGGGGRIAGKEEDCWTERKKGWGLEEEEEGVKGRGREEGGTRESKRQARENTQAKQYNSLRGARRKHAIDSVLKPPTNNSH